MPLIIPEMTLEHHPPNTAVHAGHTMAISRVLFGHCPNKPSVFCVESIRREGPRLALQGWPSRTDRAKTGQSHIPDPPGLMSVWPQASYLPSLSRYTLSWGGGGGNVTQR